MASEIQTDMNTVFIAELKDCAKLLADKLQDDNFDEASVLIQS
jgi:chemotaxis protein CheZ